MENSKYQNISPEDKKMWNNELIEIYGDDSKVGKDLMYKDNKDPAWSVILSYIIRDIRYNCRLSSEKEWVKFLSEETDILPGTIYAAINKMKKLRMLLELGLDKWLIPNLRVAIILGIADNPIVMKWLLPGLITRREQEQLWETKKQSTKYFIKRDKYLKNKNKKN